MNFSEKSETLQKPKNLVQEELTEKCSTNRHATTISVDCINKPYIYRPVRVYVTTILATWGFWFCALIFKEGFICTLTMLLGLLSPATIALITVFGSKIKAEIHLCRRNCFCTDSQLLHFAFNLLGTVFKSVFRHGGFFFYRSRSHFRIFNDFACFGFGRSRLARLR